SQLGRISGDFLVVFDGTRPDADGCVPISKTGAFRIGRGAKLNVEAQGKFCDSTGVATYTYTFTGGTCRFAHATGSGTWLVPAAATYDPATGRGTGPESLDGTIQF
ncbi:MAG TPA: hypothetical protein VFO77_01090, partial [Actinoplanes sp.]|nr:hypothetical protein [Actinoplanes sp.]